MINADILPLLLKNQGSLYIYIYIFTKMSMLQLGNFNLNSLDGLIHSTLQCCFYRLVLKFESTIE